MLTYIIRKIIMNSLTKCQIGLQLNCNNLLILPPKGTKFNQLQWHGITSARIGHWSCQVAGHDFFGDWTCHMISYEFMRKMGATTQFTTTTLLIWDGLRLPKRLSQVRNLHLSSENPNHVILHYLTLHLPSWNTSYSRDVIRYLEPGIQIQLRKKNNKA